MPFPCAQESASTKCEAVFMRGRARRRDKSIETRNISTRASKRAAVVSGGCAQVARARAFIPFSRTFVSIYVDRR